MKSSYDNESELNFEVYMDYLSSEIEDSKILNIDSTKHMIYIEYLSTIGESDRIKNYIHQNLRFKDIISKVSIIDNFEYYRIKSNDIISNILLIDRFFYSANTKWTVRNIKWEEHPILKIGQTINISGFMDNNSRFKNLIGDAKKANIPDENSLIKGLGFDGYEFLSKDDVDPIRIDLENEAYLQFILFKYICEDK